jgi:HAD superfamily hydrolase (TIGR01490 family)
MPNHKGFWCLPLCCRTVGTSVESSGRTTAAFFDLDKTIISRSSTLAFAAAFYRYGLISRSQACRGALAQLTFRLAGAGPARMERIKEQVSALCAGWPADEVRRIVTEGIADTIWPCVYTGARDLVSGHQRAGHDIVIVSTSGQEIAGPIGTMLGATSVIATRLQVAQGRYTGLMDFYAYGQAKADHAGKLAASRGYRLDECFAYSDSVTDLPLLELVGHPYAVNPDRALRKVARERSWPQLTFRQTEAAGSLALAGPPVA